MKKKTDPNQIDLFAGTDFAPPPPQQKKPTYIRRVDVKDIESEKDLYLRFAKTFKHSIAFVECVLSGKLPGNYHGTPLWIRNLGNGVWMNENIEDADYWMNKGFQLLPQENGQIVNIIKIK